MPTTNAITTKIVPHNQRLNFWPNIVGIRNTMLLQEFAFRWAQRLYADYNGGTWDFVHASNESAYMALPGNQQMRVVVPTNGYEGTMSSDAAGIVATLFALSDLANRTEDDRIIELYYKLRELASEHAESREILRAID